MNKLVIIGNGFDLAHGLKTRYEDFLLWEINEAFQQKSRIIESPLFKIESSNSIIHKLNGDFFQFETIEEFLKFLDDHKNGITILKISYTNSFIKHLIEFASKNWVDIEREYYKQLINIYKLFETGNGIWKNKLTELNSGLELIKTELETYLTTVNNYNGFNHQIMNHLIKEMKIDKLKELDENILFLNFNYTSTIQDYISDFDNVAVNYIHGKLLDPNNPLIFGYGDESDDNYEKIEKLDHNEFLNHMKSFAYLQTSNYKNLFEYLGKGGFDVYIMGHSLGLSDRLLFNHIFEHDNFKKVQLYFYVYKNNNGKIEADFFEKTQQLSRYFKINSKHKMRTNVVPYNESKPLILYNK